MKLNYLLSLHIFGQKVYWFKHLQLLLPSYHYQKHAITAHLNSTMRKKEILQILFNIAEKHYLLAFDNWRQIP